MYNVEEALINQANADFIALLGDHRRGIDEDLLAVFIDVIRKESPYFFELATRYMTTGGEAARESVKNDFCASIDFAMVGVTLDTIRKYTDPDDTMLEQLLGSRWNKSTEIGLRWHYLSEEMITFEHFGGRDTAWYRFRDLCHTVQSIPDEMLRQDWFWRGLVVHSFAYEELARERHVNTVFETPQPEFLHWAGTHEDVESVIHATKEYRTLDIRVLQSRMENNGTLHPLHDGSL